LRTLTWIFNNPSESHFLFVLHGDLRSIMGSWHAQVACVGMYLGWVGTERGHRA
jgi:hypothetical protein